MWYEVDLRRRYDGESIECIYSSNDYYEAYKTAEKWNEKNVANYDVNNGWDYYIDGNDGLIAYVYYIDNKADLHGVGMF